MIPKQCAFASIALLASAATAVGSTAPAVLDNDATQTTSKDTRPHIWFILSDDHGWNSIGYHNPDLITPNIDRLVEDGRELTRHYVYKFCSPTRSSLISGRLPIHVNQENSATEQPLAGIVEGMTTVSERLNGLGYSCHQVGKWHCGQASWKQIPSGRGFNSSLGFFNFGEDHYTQRRGGQALTQDSVSYSDAPGSNCQGVDLWKTNAPAFGYNGTYAGYIYTDEAIRVIKERPSNRPLFLFTAFQNIHPPLQVPAAYVQMQKTKALRTNVNGMVTFLDESIGNITRVVKSEGIWDNTLIVFSADNGGYLGGSGGDDTPRRGGKFGDFEGGTRVNAWVSGGMIPAAVRGTPMPGIVHIADWYGTFVHLAGSDDLHDARAAAQTPPLPQVDSLNMWFAVSGSNATSPRTEVVLSALDGKVKGYRDWETKYFVEGEAIIQNNFKLILGGMHAGPFGGNTSAHCQSLSPPWNSKTNPGVPCTCGTDGCLYDVVADPNETNDLSAKFPEVVQRLQARMVEVRKTVFNPDRGALDPRACDVISTNNGFWGPWLP